MKNTTHTHTQRQQYSCSRLRLRVRVRLRLLQVLCAVLWVRACQPELENPKIISRWHPPIDESATPHIASHLLRLFLLETCYACPE